MPISREKIIRENLVSFGESHAIVIGIDSYEKINASLSTPIEDATRLGKMLIEQQGYKPDHVHLLTDLTKKDFEALIADLKDEKGKYNISTNDSFLFYYAGHGLAGEVDEHGEISKENQGSSGYIMPADVSFQNALIEENDTLVKMNDLFKVIHQLNCHHTLVILDCCFAGAFRHVSLTRSGSSVGFRPMSKVRFDTFLKKKAFQVFRKD